MLKSKISLFGQNWIDTIFEGRNKKYGAYELRNKGSKRTVIATVLGAFIFILLIMSPTIIKELSLRLGKKDVLDQEIRLVALPPPPPKPMEEKILPPAPPKKEVQTVKDVKKFVPPTITPDEPEEEMVAQEDLKTVDVGSKDVKGQEDGEIVIDEVPVEHKPPEYAEPGDGIYDFTSIEIKPEYPGGLKKFQEYLALNLQGLELSDPSGRITVEVSFIVEKDGTLTDLNTSNDGGDASITRRIMRVLEKSKKWKPGMNNGQPQRVRYNQPITIAVPKEG